MNNYYNVIDRINDIIIPDSFVIRPHKLGTGHGEAKLYLGSKKNCLSFFGQDGFDVPCAFHKQNLVKYFLSIEDEFKNPSQNYNLSSSIYDSWIKHYDEIKKCNKMIYFRIQHQLQLSGPRVYVKSKNKEFDLLRRISLPNLTYLCISKLKLKMTHDLLFLFELYSGEFKKSGLEVKTIYLRGF